MCQNSKQKSKHRLAPSGVPVAHVAKGLIKVRTLNNRRFVPVELPPLLTAVARRRHAFRGRTLHAGLRRVVPVARLASDLEDKFLANGAGEVVVGVGDDDEGTGAADDAIGVVEVEVL